MPIRAKRVYEPATPDDGYRVLIDGICPRGVSRRRAALDESAREPAPSDDLRRWYGHDQARFEEFARRYRSELDAQRPAPDRAAPRAADDTNHQDFP